jgi:hypothetical protein
MICITAPSSALINTILKGAHLYTISSVNVISTMTKSAGVFTALVKTGLYNAASNIPTTEALTPFNAA